MLRIFVGVTHKPWFDFLRTRAPDEVNFWQPSGTGEFKALRPGDLFLFKLKAPFNAIAGGGVFAHASVAPLSMVWDAFRQKNGNSSKEEMAETIAALRRVHETSLSNNPAIGCRILTQPFFWPEQLWLPAPKSFAANTVVGKGYSTDDQEGLALWQAVEDRMRGTVWDERDASHRRGAPSLLERRLGQGAFRLAVTDGYNRRCAVSGERTLPILDAAHIKSYASGGEHSLSNGLLLRTDIHRLFDLGYVSISEQNRFVVSRRLKADFDNGVHYYALDGRELAGPRAGYAPPSTEALKWHRDNRYLG